jgi:hypothetical protein
MRNISDKSCRENQNTHFCGQWPFLFFENFTFGEIMWKIVVEQDRPQMTIWRMRVACWVPKATDTYSEFVILTAFPLQ